MDVFRPSPRARPVTVRAATADSSSSNWAGTGSSSTQALPAGSYSLAMNCNNLVDDCVFTVDTFGYLY